MKIDYRKIAENIEASKKLFDEQAVKQEAEGKAAAIEWLHTSESTVPGSDISLPNLLSYETLQTLLRGSDVPDFLKGESEHYVRGFRDEVRRIVAEIRRTEAA